MSNAAIEQERVARLRREQDEDDDRNRAVRAAQKGHDTEPPPVDEDAAAEARAYERGKREGRAQAIADGAGYLRLRGWCVDAAQLEEHEREHRAGPVCAKCESAKQGAASS